MGISKEENGTYTVQYRIRDWTGNIVHKKKRGFEKKKDAKEWEAATRYKSSNFSMSLEAFVEVYYEDKKFELKERTLEHKRDIINRHIIPYFGKRPINEITAADLIQWQNHISEMNYKPTYLNDIHKHLSALFSHACKIYDLRGNPCKKINKMGKSSADELNFWTINQYNLFIEQLEKGTKYHVLFELLFWTGMRIGEALALTRSDIEIEQQRIKINKTYYRRNRKDYVTTPKTVQSNRIIEVPQFLITELSEYIKKIYALSAHDRIFPIIAESVQHKLRREIKKGELLEIRVHDLRHAYVKLLLKYFIIKRSRTSI